VERKAWIINISCYFISFSSIGTSYHEYV